jgi:superfamily I DNA/RNA helicase
MRCLDRLIAEPVHLIVPLRRELEGEITQMEQLLTGIQFAIINILLSKDRVLVEGGAGTGKTVLAIESAVRESQGGRKILFCCKSGPLAKYVASKLGKINSIDVRTIDELESLMDDHSLLDVVKKSKWESIYIDEGQDIDLDWWDRFDSISEIPIKIFADSNQAIYRNRDDLATRMNAVAIPLGINLRNTQKIASVTEHLYTGPLIQCFGPQGVSPLIYECSIDISKQQVADLITKLNIHDLVSHSMITVLVPNAEMREEIILFLSKRKIPATDAMRKNENSVIVETVGRFKGLESPVVILLADRMLSRNQELSYVAVSRARSRLFVVGVTNGTILGNALDR